MYIQALVLSVIKAALRFLFHTVIFIFFLVNSDSSVFEKSWSKEV